MSSDYPLPISTLYSLLLYVQYSASFLVCHILGGLSGRRRYLSGYPAFVRLLEILQPSISNNFSTIAHTVESGNVSISR